MGKKNKYFAKVGGTEYVFSGEKYIYDGLKSKLGIKLLTERTVDSTIANRSKPITSAEEVKKALPRIRLVLAVDGAITGGNAAQESNTRRTDVYCDPDSVEKALLGVLNVSLNDSGVTGSNRRVKIVDAYIPRKRCYV
ncbi:MAG: hypothetical protein AAFQ63_12130 [Cyanobacteria bacterium J06621_11]